MLPFYAALVEKIDKMIKDRETKKDQGIRCAPFQTPVPTHPVFSPLTVHDLKNSSSNFSIFLGVT